jgi:nucleoside-triphosphatase
MTVKSEKENLKKAGKASEAGKKIAVTGRPGVGKTTLCLRIFEGLSSKIKIGGFITREVREGGRRVGFKVVDLQSGESFWLARKGSGKVMVGSYAVMLDEFEGYISRSINKLHGDLIIIDEVGPMELKSRVFVRKVEELITSQSNLLFTIHYKSRHPLLERIRREFEVYEITLENRDRLAEEIMRKIEGVLP